MRFGPVKRQPQQRLDFGEYLDGLYGYAMVLLRNSAWAEDLIQETCLHALRGREGLRSGDSAKSWLFTILRNVWLYQLRHRRTAPDVVGLDPDESRPNEPAVSTQDPHTVYTSKIEREQVQAAIQQLPAEFREIIILREYEEFLAVSPRNASDDVPQRSGGQKPPVYLVSLVCRTVPTCRTAALPDAWP